MLATGYTVGGMLVIITFSLTGCCVFAKSAGGYDDFSQDDEVVIGLKTEKAYNKVDLSTDA